MAVVACAIAAHEPPPPPPQTIDDQRSWGTPRATCISAASLVSLEKDAKPSTSSGVSAGVDQGAEHGLGGHLELAAVHDAAVPGKLRLSYTDDVC
jgi:hypothetical protein